MAASRPRSTRATTARKGATRGREGSGPAPAACPVALCPICMTVTALGEVRPELMEHLLVAGREVMLAMRTIIDARLAETAAPAKLQRLTIE
jgi:hypothetical protein